MFAVRAVRSQTEIRLSQKRGEVFFYDTFFDNTGEWIDETQLIVGKAEELAENYGLNGMDALHVAAAVISQSDEFITAERSTSPLSRVTEIKIISIN